MYGIKDRNISVPFMKRKKPLRDIMNRYEVMLLLKVAAIDKHRIAFALAYGSGLRVRELVHVQVRDIDLVRKTVHVRNGKGGYNRFVPISDDFIRGYSKYLNSHHIIKFVFSGQAIGTNHGSGNKNMQLIIAEFVRRFAMHILPHRFVRIRHYGILSYHARANKIERIQKNQNYDPPKVKIVLRPTININQCSFCKHQEMIFTILQKNKTRSP